MTEKMKTVCVGRFLVDVPAHAEVSLSREMIDGFEIETIEESEAAFRERVAAREAEIAANAAAGSGAAARSAGGLVEARDLRVPGMIGRTLVFGRTRSYAIEGGRRVDDEWVSIEAHAHKGPLSFMLSMKYADEAEARTAEALLARLDVRGEDEIPAAPGFCVRRALFAEPLPPHDTEHVTMHVGLPDHPDVALAFASLPGGARERTLLARVAETDAAAGADELLRVTRLRSGRRDINGIGGEEVLERVRELNFTTGYGFMWEAPGVKDSLSQPFLSLELQGGISPRPGGKPVDTSLHEDAVLALWQSISSSIRLRPSGPPPGPAAAPEPPPPALGAVAHAGQPCPQSGWWRCSEGGSGLAVQGGTVHYLRKGERMPQALLLPRQTVWQKLRGIQPSVEPAQRTAWTLVDKRQRPRTPALVALATAMPADAGPGTPASAVALGSRVRTGEACPASGWWRCEEALALDGARWFPRGSLLPAATFQVPAGLFRRAAGPETIQRRSTWELMRLAEAETVAAMPGPASRAMPDAAADAASGGPAALA